MKNLKTLPKEIQNLLISVYEIGYTDAVCSIQPYNNFVTNEAKIEYLDAIINQEVEECEITLIDSVS